MTDTAQPAASRIGNTSSLRICLPLPFPPIGLTSTNSLLWGVEPIYQQGPEFELAALSRTYPDKRHSWLSEPIPPLRAH